MEENDPTAGIIVDTLIFAYVKPFRNIGFTLHPSGQPGEVQGKRSNIRWAARAAARNYTDPISRQNCIYTVIDGTSPQVLRIFSSAAADIPRSSRHAAILQILCPTHEATLSNPRNGSNNSLRCSYHIRPQLPQSGDPGPSGRHSLVCSRPFWLIPWVHHYHSDICILRTVVTGGNGWRVGCQCSGDW